MNITKENIINVLKDVIYFPQGDNIVALEMVENLEFNANRISFNLCFENPAEEKNKIVIDASTKALKEAFGNIEVSVTAAMPSSSALAKVKHIILVASGKGGVGKSTVSVNFAMAMAMQGFKVGLLDADIYGPSIPIMFGTEETRPQCYEENGKTVILPVEKYGIKILSIGHFADKDQPLIWRGPMAVGALNQLMTETRWDDLDYLIVDMPPGTGDIQISMAQSYPITGAIIVTTPQMVAFADVKRAAMMFRHENVNVPILGLVENMAYFTPSDMPEKKYFIFGKGHGQEFAKELGVKLLGQIPIDEKVAAAGDNGTPFAFDEFSPVTAAFDKVAKQIINMF